ncbi:MAG: EAL domain-containing protein [Peptostreptococcaceae bacterium]|nr:EAL domain-containing protein [Peptostreptococcaceae bacterium]
MFLLYILFLLVFVMTIFWDKAVFVFENNLHYTSYFIIAMDVIILIAAVIFLFSTAFSPVQTHLKLIFLGVSLFLVRDIGSLYIETPFFLKLDPHQSIFGFPFVLFAVASLQKVSETDSFSSLSGKESRNVYFMQTLIVLPLLFYPILSGKVIPTLIGGGLIAFYLLIGSIARNNVSGYRFIEMEKRINHALDELVKQRTAELTQLNMALERQSLIDPLTGIYNRRHYIQSLDTVIGRGIFFHIIAVSINRLRLIGDTYGHTIGDFIVQTAASRISEVLLEKDSLFYIANNEFAVLSPGSVNKAELNRYLAQIMSKVGEPIEIHSYQFIMEVSISVIPHPKYADTRENLMKYSEMALRRAKKDFMPSCIFFDDEMKQEIDRRKRLDLAFRSVDPEKEMEVLYQPQFDISAKRLIGMESFLVWNHPTEGPIYLSELLSLIEGYDFIFSVGSYALNKIFTDIRQWNEKYEAELKVSINIPAKQLRYPFFLRDFIYKMDQADISPKWIELEVSENTVMLSFDYIVDFFKEIAASGICVSMDEFGEGYSSLSAIKQLNIHRLKISESLTRNILTEKGRTIVRAIVMMAEGLGLEVMADDVNSKEELMALSKLGCSKIQGNCLGVPVSAKVFEMLYLQNENLKK